ncbi:helix-turn-helix domain-containing protein [Paenibacillus stellifer]|uniref:helix-turn-helix domain-containing protein n=1 Tax=Paenibacillus stellifer TaxID=169760 RepID=UPI00068D6C2A|nr:helix-turn-helix transcriptional regulator [Paenibacillus stellifer]
MSSQGGENFGDFFRRLRRSKGYKSQKQLAADSGVSQATISRIEDGTQKPQKETLNALAHVLGVTPGALFYAAGYIGMEDLGQSDYETGLFNIVDTTGEDIKEYKGVDAWEYRKKRKEEREQQTIEKILNEQFYELLFVLNNNNEIPVHYNGQLLKPEEVNQILLMLKALFPEYSRSLED